MSHFFRVIRAYRPIIGLSVAAVVLGYLILAVAVYVLGPSQRVTSLAFRLDFEGADKGTYPNGTKFSSAEINATPILLKVYDINKISRFVKFKEFARSVFVLQSSGDQEAMARFYRTRLSDPRLTPIDRERIEREYALKIASLSKSEYTINYLHSDKRKPVPEIVIRKALHDVLREWAEFVSTEQHVLEYRVTILSPSMVASSRIEDANPIIAAEILRATIQRILANIEELKAVPSSELIRSKPEGLSLADISIRLDELTRFRLEPLVHSLAVARLDDRPSTIQFLETQLAYDERMLSARKRHAEAILNALTMYTNGEVAAERTDTPSAGSRAETRSRAQGDSETVMPQLNDTFIDRLVQLTSSAADKDYRQSLANSYQRSSFAIVPVEAAVAYDRSILALVRSTVGAGSAINRESAEQQIAGARKEVRELVIKIQEIHDALSATLNSSTDLLTIVTPPTSRIDRTVKIRSIVLYGILTCLVAVPLIFVACFIHNRIREEEQADSVVEHAVTETAG